VDLSTLKARAQERLTSLLAERQTHTDELTAMRAAVESGDAAVTIESIQGVAAKRALVDAASNARASMLVAPAPVRRVDTLPGVTPPPAE
jgi:hypothetical protein